MTRVRVTIEYDTEESLAYERDAWIRGAVTFLDFATLEDASTLVILEVFDERGRVIEKLPVNPIGPGWRQT